MPGRTASSLPTEEVPTIVGVADARVSEACHVVVWTAEG
jgi:hypothetical protein